MRFEDREIKETKRLKPSSILSDEIEIAGTTWRELKLIVMTQNFKVYRKQLWFVSVIISDFFYSCLILESLN